MLPAVAEGKKQRTSSDAMRQKQQTERQQARTAGELKATEAELAAQLRRVTTLETQIAETSIRIDSLNSHLDSIRIQSAAVADSIEANEAELNRLKQLYVTAVRSARKNRRQTNSLTFIFAAQNFRQAFRRMRYLDEISTWRSNKAQQINEINAILDNERQQLELMERQTATLRSQALEEERRLKADRNELQSTVNSLKGKQKQLDAMLRKQQKTLNELDREIDRLIEKEAAEQRRREAAERKKREDAQKRANSNKKGTSATTPSSPAEPVFQPQPVGGSDGAASGGFADQKGKLPSPLSHTYIVAQGFGVQTHRSVKTLQIKNSGVDLETASNATARAVYPGEVTGVFMQSGLNYVVLIRHGEHITVYANLESISVRKGDKVKAGDVIGKVAASPVSSGRGQLHFEIRHERNKLDPTLWLKR